MPFIEIRRTDNHEHTTVINTDAIISIDVANGAYGAFVKIILRNGEVIMNGYSSFQDAENVAASIIGELGGPVPMVTI